MDYSEREVKFKRKCAYCGKKVKGKIVTGWVRTGDIDWDCINYCNKSCARKAYLEEEERLKEYESLNKYITGE